MTANSPIGSCCARPTFLADIDRGDGSRLDAWRRFLLPLIRAVTAGGRYLLSLPPQH